MDFIKERRLPERRVRKMEGDKKKKNENIQAAGDIILRWKSTVIPEMKEFARVVTAVF